MPYDVENNLQLDRTISAKWEAPLDPISGHKYSATGKLFLYR